jgi:tetratricopeptide (TPR) repeat protein
LQFSPGKDQFSDMNNNKYVSLYFVFAAALPCTALTTSIFAATADGLPLANSRYDVCISATEDDPERAFEEAVSWRDEGGGGAAEHCVAVALLALGYAGEAAARLDALARENQGGTQEQRSKLMIQAGEAWLLTGRANLARDSFSVALQLTPRNAEAWAARARAYTADAEGEMAESDLDAAIIFDNSKPEYYVLRSTVRSALGKDELAANDLEIALQIDPNFPDALAERGLMKFEAGDEDGAREDWIKVLIVAPESAAANVVRSGIERMEIHLEP